MTQEEITKLAEKIKNKSATDEEILQLLQELNLNLKELDNILRLHQN